jgi:hypothetical protein
MELCWIASQRLSAVTGLVVSLDALAPIHPIHFQSRGAAESNAKSGAGKEILGSAQRGSRSAQ